MEPSSTIEPSNQIITASGKPRESGRAGLGIRLRCVHLEDAMPVSAMMTSAVSR